MTIRPCAEFCADFPDDSIEEDGEIIQFGGRGVAEAIAAMLQGGGYDVSMPEHQHEHGWEFDVRTQGKRVWMQISDLGEMFILSTQYFPGFSLFKPSGGIYAAVLTRLNAELAGDSRFSNVRWQLQRDVDSGSPGATSPVIE